MCSSDSELTRAAAACRKYNPFILQAPSVLWGAEAGGMLMSLWSKPLRLKKNDNSMTQKSHTHTQPLPPQSKTQTKNSNKEKKPPHKTKIPHKKYHKIPILSDGLSHCLASLPRFPYQYLFLSYPVATETLHLPLSHLNTILVSSLCLESKQKAHKCNIIPFPRLPPPLSSS